jgi:hypothetical protein
MKRNYQGVVERIKTVALAHPQVKSADVGRELEFDINKSNIWPRVFLKTEGSAVIGGQGTVELVILFSMLVMDRLKTDRTNIIDVLNQNHSIATDILATLNKEQLIRIEDGATLTPLYDYQDTQTAGWEISLRVYTDIGFECYLVDGD